MKQYVKVDKNFNILKYKEFDSNGKLIFEETYTYFKNGRIRAIEDSNGCKRLFYNNKKSGYRYNIIKSFNDKYDQVKYVYNKDGLLIYMKYLISEKVVFTVPVNENLNVDPNVT